MSNAAEEDKSEESTVEAKAAGAQGGNRLRRIEMQ
jgi:hypothetical protein